MEIAFLNGELDKEIYMKQTEGFAMPGHDNDVCKLVKSLYKLKLILSNGFVLNQADICVI